MGQATPLHVLVSGAAGQIGYALIPLIASGQAFGPDQPVVLHLLDIEPAKSSLEGVRMEVEDGGYALVHGVIASTDYAEAFKDVDVAVLVGGFPRKKGMLRKDLLAKNKPIFVAAGEALGKYAKPDVKVLVVANPANTNCLVASKNAPNIPKENFTALTFLDMNRARAQLALRIGCPVSQVKNAIIYGNHSKTQVPDAFSALYTDASGQSKPVSQVINDDGWLKSKFMEIVQTRGASVIQARGLSSAMSAANAIKDHLHAWFVGTPDGEVVSMGVYSDGSAYGVASDIVFSFPVTCSKGKYTIVKDMTIQPDLKEFVSATEKELLEEKAEALAA